MKKIIKSLLLILIPTIITPLILTSCSTKKEIISSKKEIINRDRYIGEIKAHIDILIEKIEKKENNRNDDKKLIEIKKIIRTYFCEIIKKYYSSDYKNILRQLYKEINNKNNSELIEINIKLNDILNYLSK